MNCCEAEFSLSARKCNPTIHARADVNAHHITHAPVALELCSATNMLLLVNPQCKEVHLYWC